MIYMMRSWSDPPKHFKDSLTSSVTCVSKPIRFVGTSNILATEMMMLVVFIGILHGKYPFPIISQRLPWPKASKVRRRNAQCTGTAKLCLYVRWGWYSCSYLLQSMLGAHWGHIQKSDDICSIERFGATYVSCFCSLENADLSLQGYTSEGFSSICGAIGIYRRY